MANVAFLVYDSRSGSTILSSVVDHRFSGLFVTPEVAFDQLLERSFSSDKAASSAPSDDAVSVATLNKVMNSDGFRNIASDLKGYELPADQSRLTCKQFICSVLERHLQVSRRVPTAERHDVTTLVKNGSHIKYVGQLQAVFGDQTPFLFLYRDPRDVVASKLRTQRPYRPSEVMAWGGVLVAAIRWHKYAHLAIKARQAGARILFVSYEDFVTDSDMQLRSIGTFLCVCQARKSSGSEYAIPEQEQEIHQSALLGCVDSSKVNSWQNAFARYELVVLEYLCRRTMRELGYQSSVTARAPEILYSLCKAALVSSLRVSKTYALRLTSSLVSVVAR